MARLFRIIAVSIFGLLTLCVQYKHASSQSLRADLNVTIAGPSWSYVLVNTEPTSSSDWITSFYLPIAAPVTNLTAPEGWYVDTDHANYILWSNQDAYPYPHDVPPGFSLSGFGFTSTANAVVMDAAVSSWDHRIDEVGPEVMIGTLSPNSSVPEPAVLWFLLACATTAGIAKGTLWRQQRSG